MFRVAARSDIVNRIQFSARRFYLAIPWLGILIFALAALAGLLIGFYILLTGSMGFVDAVFLGVLLMSPFGLVIAIHLFGNLRRLLTFTLIFDLCVAINLHLFYQPLVAMVSAVPGFDFSVVTLSLIALYGWWLLEHMTGRTQIPVRSLLAESKPLVAYVAFTFASLIVAEDWLLASFELNMVVQGLLLYIFIIYTVTTRQQVLFVVTVLILGLGLQGALMMVLKVTGGTLDIGFLRAEPDSWGRLSGTVGGPNPTAAFLVMWLGLTFGLMLTPASYKLKLMGLGATVVAMAGLFFTFSRGGWLAFAITITIIALVAWRHGWIPLYVPFVVGVVGTAAVVPAWPYIMARLFGDDGGSAEARLPLMRMALSIIRDHPILGVGPNNYVSVLPEYLTAEYTGTWIRVVHNKFLLVWAESGIGALLAFLWFLFDTLYRAWRVIRANDPYLSPLALGLAAAIVGWMAHMQVALFHDTIQVYTLCLSSALIAAMAGMVRGEA